MFRIGTTFPETVWIELRPIASLVAWSLFLSLTSVLCSPNRTWFKVVPIQCLLVKELLNLFIFYRLGLTCGRGPSAVEFIYVAPLRLRHGDCVAEAGWGL